MQTVAQRCKEFASSLRLSFRYSRWPTRVSRRASTPTRPVARPAAGVRKRKDYDLFRPDLVDERERKAVQNGHPTVAPISPLRCRLRKPKGRFDSGIDLVLQLCAEAGTARFVIVDLVIDLSDRESMDCELQRIARAARRRRMWARYSSSVIVSAEWPSTSSPRRWISASHACTASASASPSRLRISSSARRARSSAGRRRMSARMSVAPTASMLPDCRAQTALWRPHARVGAPWGPCPAGLLTAARSGRCAIRGKCPSGRGERPPLPARGWRPASCRTPRVAMPHPARRC